MRKRRFLLALLLIEACVCCKADPIYIVRDWIQYRLDPETKTALVGTGAAEDNSYNALAYPDIGDSYWTTPYDLGHANIVIPSTIDYGSDTYIVNRIGVNAFARTTEVHTIVLPETIEVIDTKAFSTCVNLESISIPDGVQLIEPSTFEACTGLKTVHLGENIKIIGESAFIECLNLQEINIPARCESIGNDAFTWCKALSKVIIEDGTEPLAFGYSYEISQHYFAPVCPKNEDGRPHIRGQFADCALKYIYMGRNITFPQGREWNSIGYNAIYRSFPPFEACSELYYNNENYYRYNYSPPVLDTFIIGDNVSEIADSLFLAYIERSTSFDCMIRDDVVFPNTVKRIGRSAFQFMLNQDNMVVPESVEEIGEGAFKNNYLKSVTIQGGNTIIGASAFYNNNIEKLTLGEGITAIYGSAFQENYITEVSIPKSVTYIGDVAFYENQIKEITIPQNVSYLGGSIFGKNNLRFVHCETETPPCETFPFESAVVYVPHGKGKLYRSKWEGLIIDPDDEYISINVRTPGSLYSRLLAQDLQLTDVYRLKLKGTLNDDDITMINRMSNLYDWDFSELNMTVLPKALIGNNSVLVNIKLPDVLTKIEAKAFLNCDHLGGTIQIPDACTSIGDSAFYNSGIDKLSVIGATTIGRHAFQNSYMLNNVTFANNVIIADSAFLSTNINNVSIKRGMRVGKNVFDSVKEAIIEDGVAGLEDAAFNTLEKLTFAGAVGSIGKISCSGEIHVPDVKTWLELPFESTGPMESTSRLFFNETEAVNVVIPENVKTIRPYAFYNCRSLASIQIPIGVKEIKESAFYGCESLSSISLPTGIKVIDNKTFYGCNALESIILPATLDSIKSQAFANCENLQNFELPSKITYIGEKAFINCKGLSYVSLPLKLEYIGKDAFYSCTKLTTIKFQSSLNTIGESAFFGCSSITELDIPNSLRLIGDNAFGNCSGLKTVIVHWQEPITITNRTFSGFDTDCLLYVPIMTSTKYAMMGWDVFPNLREGGVMEITSNEGGEVLYADTNLRNTTNTYIFTPYRSFYINFKSDEGYYLKKVRLNGENVTSQIEEGKLFIEEPEEDLMISVVFANNSIVDGDVNGDGIINLSDVVDAASYILKNTPHSFYKYAADINNDEAINITDMVIIQRRCKE